MLQKLASVWICWAAMLYPTRQLHGYASLWMSVSDCELQFCLDALHVMKLAWLSILTVEAVAC